MAMKNFDNVAALPIINEKINDHAVDDRIF